jgi:hypothetical protein
MRIEMNQTTTAGIDLDSLTQRVEGIAQWLARAGKGDDAFDLHALIDLARRAEPSVAAVDELLREIDEELAGSDLNIGSQRRLLHRARTALASPAVTDAMVDACYDNPERVPPEAKRLMRETLERALAAAPAVSQKDGAAVAAAATEESGWAPEYKDITDHHGRRTGVLMTNADQMPCYSIYAATTASASAFNDPEFHRLAFQLARGYNDDSRDSVADWCALASYVDRRAQAPSRDATPLNAVEKAWRLGLAADVDEFADLRAALARAPLSEYAPGQWWLKSLEALWGHGQVDNDTRRAAKVACNFAAAVFTQQAEVLARAPLPAQGDGKKCQYPNCGCTSRTTCNFNYDAQAGDAQEYARVREEFELATKLGARFDIDSAMLNVDALLNARRAAPVGEVELPALPEPLRFAQWTGGEVFAYTAEQVRQAQRQAFVAGRLAAIADSQREVASDLAAIKARLAVAQRPTQSISSNEFRNLIEAHDRASDFEEMGAAYGAIVAYIDGRTAGAAPDARVEDLAALVRQLVHSLNKVKPDSDLAKRAVDYLQRKGLAGSPLRADDSPQPGKEGGND